MLKKNLFMPALSNIQEFLDKFDNQDGSRNWRGLEKDLIGVTELITGDQGLKMNDVGEMLDISFRQKIDLETLEESLFDLADEYESDDDESDDGVDNFEDDYGYEDDDYDEEYDYEFDSEYDDDYDYGYDDEDDFGDFDEDIDLFVEKYDDMDGSRNWRRLEKDLIGVTQLINGDQNLTMKGVSELFGISFKQRIDLESIEESLYELADGSSSSEDDYGYDDEDDYGYDDEDDSIYGNKDDDNRDVFTGQDDAEFSVSSADVEDRLISIQLNSELGPLVPSSKKFVVKSNGKKQKITTIEIFPEDGIVTLAMKKSLAGSKDILISYRDLKGDQKRGVIENMNGEDLPSFKNLVPDITSNDETPPSLIDAYIDENQLYLEFDEILEKDSLKKSTLKVSQGKKRVLVRSGETYIDDVIAVYELKNNVPSGIDLTLDYRDPRGDQGSGVIQDQNGNDLLSISGYEILT